MDENKSVVLFVIDGLRPDILQETPTPTIDGLMAAGAHTLAARTVMPSVSLPCHASLFLSVPPEQHGVVSNTWSPQADHLPGLIDVVHQAGGRTASFYTWEPFRDLSRPGSLDASYFLNNCSDPTGAGDRALAELAADWFAHNEAALAFVYLGNVDAAGHDTGYTSEAYRQTIRNADECIALVLDALPADCAVLLTSDHGGHDHSHGSDCAEDMTIPLVIRAPGLIPAGATLAQDVSIMDVAPTAAALLGLDRPAEWVGRPLLDC